MRSVHRESLALSMHQNPAFQVTRAREVVLSSMRVAAILSEATASWLDSRSRLLQCPSCPYANALVRLEELCRSNIACVTSDRFLRTATSGFLVIRGQNLSALILFGVF